MQAAADNIVPPIRRSLVLGSALLLCLLVAGLRFADTGSALLNLRPLIDAPKSVAHFEALESLFASAALPSRLAAAAFCGLAALLAFLVFEQVLRQHAKLRNEAAAFLGAIAFCAAPIGACCARLSGGPELLLAFCIACGAVLLATTRLALLSVLLAAILPVLHPLGVGLALWPLLALIGVGRKRELLVALALLGLELFTGFVPLPESLPGLEQHLLAGLHTFLATPCLVLDGSVRVLLPTGAEWVSGTMPVAAGAAVWLLVSGLACMVGRFRVTMPLLLCAALSCLVAPVLVDGWLPGDAGTLFVTAWPLVFLVVLVLGPVAGRWWPEVVCGLCLGIVVIAVTAEYRVRGPRLSLRRHALAIPQRTHPALMFAPELETDPVRLALYMEDMTHLSGRLDPQVLTSGVCAELLLRGPRPAALEPERVLSRVRAMMEAPGSVPLDAPAKEAWIFEKLPPLTDALNGILLRLNNEGPERAYQSSADELVALVPSLAEVLLVRAQHPKIRQAQAHAVDVLRVVAEWASKLGDLSVSLPLRELIVEALARDARAVAILGRELVEAGRYAEARPILEEALRGMKGKDILWCVTRGALGRALVAEDQAAVGLEHMDAAWGGLVGGVPGASQRLSQISDPHGLDYWLVVELLLARYEATRTLHPTRVVQARTDLLRTLDAAKATGRERLPALLAEGRVALLEGEDFKARSELRKARNLRSSGLTERGTGSEGRLDYPRYRSSALQSLLRCLNRPEDAVERSEVEAELRALPR
ncbi:MAG: hypothetical protein EXS14_08250 [Planctomycetes bacterium]|nr:hypothetical protein [Planctomycetota bacterium]